jgi:glycosyltransferase involved in cell wall biosynthesis
MQSGETFSNRVLRTLASEMRVLYDHQVFSLQNAGGASRYHFELARNLSSRTDVSVSAYLGLNASVHPFATLKNADVLSIQTDLRPGLLRYAANEVFTGIGALIGGRWDIYHPTLYRAMPCSRSRKMVVTHHDCTHERFPHLFADVARTLGAKKKLYTDADAIICVSESSRRDLLFFYSIDASKAHVIHHGITPIHSGTRTGNGTVSRSVRPYLLYVGARSGYKNFARLLRAYASAGLNRDYDLLAIGGGKWTQQEIELARRLGVRDRLLLTACADDSVLAEAYLHAALFVYPSLYEGFGFPPLEAMSASCITAVSGGSSIEEVCGSAAFYFDPADEWSIEQTLIEALHSPSRPLKAKLGLERVREFTWSRCAERTLQVYGSN